MYAVYLNKEEGLTREEFIDRLLKICKDHKNESRALAFAFLVYDFHDHTIRQILENNYYYDSIHTISGKFLTVFYIDSQETRFKQEQQEIYEKENAETPKGTMSHWYSMVLRDTPLDKTINFLKETFGISENIKHPFVIFFQSDGEIIIDNFVVTLRHEKLEEAFLELKSHVKEAVDSLSKIQPDQVDNHQNIFNLIEGRVKRGVYVSFIKTKAKGALTVGTLITLAKLILGFFK